jgi:hypothetical protein
MDQVTVLLRYSRTGAKYLLTVLDPASLAMGHVAFIILGGLSYLKVRGCLGAPAP